MANPLGAGPAPCPDWFWPGTPTGGMPGPLRVAECAVSGPFSWWAESEPKGAPSGLSADSQSSLLAAKPYAWPSPVFLDEFDACSF
jgi:hypothetical protein